MDPYPGDPGRQGALRPARPQEAPGGAPCRPGNVYYFDWACSRE